jgi:ABC-type cobalamin/Fe3+-siderophores transport system ATPase subunit
MKLNEIIYPYQLETSKELNPEARIILVGDNGVGKSLLIESLKWHRYQSKLPLWSFIDQGKLTAFDRSTVKDYLDLLITVAGDHFLSSDYENWMGFKEVQFTVHLKKDLTFLSGGEHQWLKIMIGLNLKTSGFIFDEPTQSLDQNKKNLFWQLLESRLKKEDLLMVVLHQEKPPFDHEIWNLKASELSMSLT